MAHYAELDANNQVLRVLVIPNEVEPTEQDGIAYLEQLFGGGTWRKTSYNGNIRKNYAGRGYQYDEYRDAFIAPKPFPSWLFNEETCRWYPPKPYPDPTGHDVYRWDEITTNWVLMS